MYLDKLNNSSRMYNGFGVSFLVTIPNYRLLEISNEVDLFAIISEWATQTSPTYHINYLTRPNKTTVANISYIIVTDNVTHNFAHFKA